MLLDHGLQPVIASSTFESFEYGIEDQNIGVILHILRNQLYSDKIAAVIREYSTNADDSHQEPRIKVKRPFEVTLPTALDPNFHVRDFGKGLSPKEIETTYIKLGSSTKRQKRKLNGCLGLGSKAGFAYSESFTIISYYNGQATTYQAFVDQSLKGKLAVLHKAPSTETGIEIIIPVKESDIAAFAKSCQTIFKHFDRPPKIIGLEEQITTNPAKIYSLGEPDTYPWRGDYRRGIYPDGRDSYGLCYAVMGNVAYKFDPRNIITDRELSRYLESKQSCVRVPLGSIQFTASREEVEYTEQTKTTIQNVLSEQLETLKKLFQAEVNKKTDLFSARLLLTQVYETFSSRTPVHENTSKLLERIFKKAAIDSSLIQLLVDPILGFTWKGTPLSILKPLDIWPIGQLVNGKIIQTLSGENEYPKPIYEYPKSLIVIRGPRRLAPLANPAKLEELLKGYPDSTISLEPHQRSVQILREKGLKVKFLMLHGRDYEEVFLRKPSHQISHTPQKPTPVKDLSKVPTKEFEGIIAEEFLDTTRCLQSGAIISDTANNPNIVTLPLLPVQSNNQAVYIGVSGKHYRGIELHPEAAQYRHAWDYFIRHIRRFRAQSTRVVCFSTVRSQVTLSKDSKNTINEIIVPAFSGITIGDKAINCFRRPVVVEALEGTKLGTQLANSAILFQATYAGFLNDVDWKFLAKISNGSITGAQQINLAKEYPLLEYSRPRSKPTVRYLKALREYVEKQENIKEDDTKKVCSKSPSRSRRKR